MAVYIMPRTRNGMPQRGKFLVKLQFTWPDGTEFRRRFIVGEGTKYPIRTERQARAFGEYKCRASRTIVIDRRAAPGLHAR